jgi:hypothetical protein
MFVGQMAYSWRDGVTESMKKRGTREEDAQDWIIWRRGLGRRRTAV